MADRAASDGWNPGDAGLIPAPYTEVPGSRRLTHESLGDLRSLPDAIAKVLPGGVAVALAVGMVSLTLAMTPYTHNLDAIKTTLFLISGPVLLLMAAGAMMARPAGPVPRAVLIGLVGYAATLVASAAVAEFQWIAREALRFHLCAAGFLMSGIVIGSRRATMEFLIRLLVIELLITNLIGIALHRIVLFGVDYGSLIDWLYAQREPAGPSDFFGRLAMTFTHVDGVMQSTILNRSFYAAFCLAHLPFAFMLAVRPGVARPVTLWRTLGVLTTLMTTYCIIETRSTTALILGMALVAGVLVFAIGALRKRRRVWIGVAVVAVLVAVISAPQLSALRPLDESIQSRLILGSGAAGVFAEHPLVGGGPGSFPILFPDHRMPDYDQHGISHISMSSFNWLFDVLAETGLIGLLFILELMLAVAWIGIRTIARTPDSRQRELLIVSLAGLGLLSLFCLTSSFLRWPIGLTVFCTLLGLTIGLLCQIPPAEEAEPGEDSPPPGRQPRPLRNCGLAGVFCLSAVMIPGSLSTGLDSFETEKAYLSGVMEMERAYSQLRQPGFPAETALEGLERSTADFHETLALQPTHPSALYKLGSIHSTIARHHRSRLTEGSRQDSANGMDVAQQTERVDAHLSEALATYQQLAVLWPNYAELPFNLGVTHRTIGDWISEAEAVNLSNRFASRSSREWYEMALEHFARQRRLSTKPAVFCAMAQLYLKLDRLDEAVDVYLEGVARDPVETAEWAQLRESLIKKADDMGQEIPTLPVLPGTE